jgi:hypothetical protein
MKIRRRVVSGCQFGRVVHRQNGAQVNSRRGSLQSVWAKKYATDDNGRMKTALVHTRPFLELVLLVCG